MITLEEVYAKFRMNLIHSFIEKGNGLSTEEATRLADENLVYKICDVLNEFDECRLGFPFLASLAATEILEPSDE